MKRGNQVLVHFREDEFDRLKKIVELGVLKDKKGKPLSREALCRNLILANPFVNQYFSIKWKIDGMKFQKEYYD